MRRRVAVVRRAGIGDVGSVGKTRGGRFVLEGGIEEKTAAVRRFNKLFTRRIGVLREGLLHSPYSLAEARIIVEIADRDEAGASELARDLGLDPGHLSRILSGLGGRGLVEKSRSEADGRRRILSLTKAGEEAFEMLDERSREEVAEMLGGLSGGDQSRLLEAMKTIEGVLDKSLKFSEPFYLRPHEPGDMGWVVHRHGILYAKEYGWDETFEALVAGIVADFINDHDPAKERVWVAEMDGHPVGCVFLVKESEAVAKLRLLLVEPTARGLGLGGRLVEECVRFAKNRGYEKITLWTNDVLGAARHIYEEKGFVLVDEKEHHSFGKDLVGQNWELEI